MPSGHSLQRFSTSAQVMSDSGLLNMCHLYSHQPARSPALIINVLPAWRFGGKNGRLSLGRASELADKVLWFRRTRISVISSFFVQGIRLSHRSRRYEDLQSSCWVDWICAAQGVLAIFAGR